MPAARSAPSSGRVVFSFAVLALSLGTGAPNALAQSCAVPVWWNANAGLLPRMNTIVPLAFTTFDPDGTGPEANFLYVCGFFDFQGSGPLSTGIARWDGVKWIGVGTGLGAGGLDIPWDMCVWDPDGAGPMPPQLVVGGSFHQAGGALAIGVAAWNGSRWTQVGEGISNAVWAVETFDEDGSGPLPPTLLAGANAPLGVRKWNGTSWVSFGLSIDNVNSLESFDPDGAGPTPPQLFALTYGSGCWRRVGNTWLATNISGLVSTYGSMSQKLVTLDPDGPGPLPAELYAAPGAGVYRWSGASWTLLPGSPGGATMKVYEPDGDGPARPWLVVGEGSALHAWDGSVWSVLGQVGLSPEEPVTSDLFSIGSFDPDGAGPQPPTLFVGGQFGTAGGITSRGLARFGCSIDFGRCAADCSFNGIVDFHDITTILASWGSTDPYADGNRDGVVGFTDITLALATWSEYCPENLGAPPAASRAEAPLRPEDISPQYAALLDARDSGDFRRVTEILVNWDAGQSGAAVDEE